MNEELSIRTFTADEEAMIRHYLRSHKSTKLDYTVDVPASSKKGRGRPSTKPRSIPRETPTVSMVQLCVDHLNGTSYEEMATKYALTKSRISTLLMQAKYDGIYDVSSLDSNAEIADKLDIPVSAVNYYLRSALKKIEKTLESNPALSKSLHEYVSDIE